MSRVLVVLAAGCSTAAATPISLHHLMQHGRQCPQASFAELDGATELEEVPVECLDTLARTAKLPHLARMSILCGDGTSIDLARLAGFPELAELRLAFGCKRDTLAPLAALPKLRVLRDRESGDFAGVDHLAQLEELEVSAQTDLAPLAALTHLRTLDLTIYNNLDLAPLAQLAGLESLEIAARDPIDLAPLAKLAQLRRLVVRAPSVTNVEALGKLAHLRDLEIGANPLAALASSAALPRLATLKIDIATSAWLAPLAKAQHLADLTLESGCTPVTIDLAPLAKLPHLETIVLSGVIHTVGAAKVAAHVMTFEPMHCDGDDY